MNSIRSSLRLSSVTFFEALEPALTKLRSVVAKAPIHPMEMALRSIRHLIDGLLLQLAKEVLQARDQKLADHPCPSCSHPMAFNRFDSSTFQFLEGEVSLLRRYLECRPCSLRLHPLDRELGIPRIGEVTPQFGHDLCLLGAELPGKAGTRILASLTGRQVHAGMIHAQVQRDGEVLAQMEREEAESLWPFDASSRLRDVIPNPSLPRLHKSPPPNPKGVVVIEMDGVLVNLGADTLIRQEILVFEAKQKRAQEQGSPLSQDPPSRYREVRQMKIYRLEDLIVKRTRSGKRRATLLRSETITVVNDPVLFQKRVNAVLRAWRIDEYKDRLVLGDGGEFLWDVAKLLINPTKEVLDSRHAKSHIHDCAKALFGTDSKLSREWAHQWSSHLLKQNVAGLLEELAKLGQKSWSPEGARKLKNLRDCYGARSARCPAPRSITFEAGDRRLTAG